MLCDLAVKQFVEIYKDEFGVTLTEDEARIKAQRTISFFKTIITEISKDKRVVNLIQRGGVLNDNKNQSNRV